MSSNKMPPLRASLAAESAAEFPLMPTWPGTQIKTISLSHLLSFPYIIQKSELRLDDHILDLILTVTMKVNQIVSKTIFVWNNQHV